MLHLQHRLRQPMAARGHGRSGWPDDLLRVPGSETEFWVAGHKAIVETLSGLGVNVIERNANEDANKQLEQVKTALPRK